MVLAMEREQTAYRSLLVRYGAVLTDHEPMLARLVRGCIAMASLLACLRHLHAPPIADTFKGSELSYMALALVYGAFCIMVYT